MLSILITATVADGHVAPMLAVAKHLAEPGHRVRFFSGHRFEDAVRRTGAEFLPWPEDAFVDEQEFLAQANDSGRTAGVRGIARAVEDMFIAPGASQYRAIRQAMDDLHTDVLITENTVVGAAAVALDPNPHVPVVVCGILPLSLSSADAAPFGLGVLPQPGVLARLRNRALNLLMRHVVLRRPQRLAQRELRALTGAELDMYFQDWGVRADLYAQFTVPGFEYPRSDLASNVHFVGPAFGTAPRSVALPDWWDDLDGRTVVHVTQGTVAISDLQELIGPTMRALADADVLVVVSTGGAPVAHLGALPENVRAAEFIPYDQLMPKVDAVVSNGGYGGLHYALAHGVPLVVAGDSEDKMETTRRVEWSGAGLNLHTALPTEQSIRDAVDRVLTEPSFRERAQALQAEIAGSPGLAGFERTVVGIVGERAVA